LVSLSEHSILKIKNAELIIIGGSAGSFMLIQQLVSVLPEDFPIPVIVILHRAKRYSTLENLLQNHSHVKIVEAREKEMLLPSTVYIAPPDYHLLIERDKSLSLDMSEPVWFCRPSIDVSFESAVEIYQDKMIGFLLSGANTDGSNGMTSIVQHGGLALVQNPEDAEFSAMPSDAVKNQAFHHLFTASEIKSLIEEIYTIKKNVHI
jgi:two-component system chemotaxis response regulator CheB